MAIDIRATTTCTLGTLISASISDDYIQGNGLIKTKGSCVISGTITPAIGTAVTFSYTKGGVTRMIPRKLRVLSSFADPFRRTTTVELGCKLTYLQDVSEPLKWDYTDDPENSGITEDDAKIITVPISASSIAAECCSRLGITGAPALSNLFSIAQFDFSAGYVSILSDLLVSECKVGYLDDNEVLQIINLSAAGGTGPVITTAQIIDVGSIGVGQLPGDAVTVSYSTLKLVEPDPVPEDPEQAEEQQKENNWEREESIGTETTVKVSNPFYDSNPFPYPVPEFFEYTYTPRTVTETAYDTLDRVTTRTTTQYTIQAELAPSYLQHISGGPGSEGLGPASGSNEYTIVTTETFVYKVKAPQVRPKGDMPEGYQEVETRIQEVSEPSLKMAASTQIFDMAGQANVSFGGFTSNSDRFIASKNVETPDAGTTLASTPATKSAVEIFQAVGYTTNGQQALASGLERNKGNTRFYGEIAPAMIREAMRLKSLGVETTINTGRDIGLQQRPSAADRINQANVKEGEPAPDPDNGWRTASTSEIELAAGSPLATRRVTLSMPYAPDDTFVKVGSPPSVTYSSAPSDAPAKARAYGRAQNMLLMGNRYGCNFQMAPETLPSAPFAPFIVQAGGLSALYRNNGTSWTVSADGVLVSTDALFYGAVGGTGVFWFPVAPGITTLPTTPPIVSGEMTVTTPVPVWNETVPMQASLRLGVDVASLPYALELLTEPGAISIVLGVNVQQITQVIVPATIITVAAYAPAVETYLAVSPPASSIVITALEPSVSTGASVEPPVAAVALAAPAPANVGYIDPYFSSVSALLLFDGANNSTTITDNGPLGLTCTAFGDAKITTAQSKFGGSSLVLDGTGDYVTVANNSALNFTTQDFTIEFFWRPSSVSTGQVILNKRATNAARGYQITQPSAAPSKIRFAVGDSNTSAFEADITGTTTLVVGTWYFIRATRSGSTFELSVDNISQGTATWSGTIDHGTGALFIGAAVDGATPANGHMDMLRITNGVARTGAVPTVQFPTK